MTRSDSRPGLSRRSVLRGGVVMAGAAAATAVRGRPALAAGGTSENGWPASDDPDAIGITTQTIPGTSVRVTVKGGDVATVLMWVAGQLAARVEAPQASQTFGYNYRVIAGSSTLSNHGSGTAIDINSVKHPQGSRGTFSAAQLSTIRDILAYTDGVVGWGGDYEAPTLADEMHWEITVEPGDPALHALVTKITTGGASPFRRSGRMGAPAVSWGPDRVDAFGRGSNGSLYHGWADAGHGGWQGWQPLGGAMASQPVAASWAIGRLDVVAVGTDRLMKHWWFDRTGDRRWRGPESLRDTTFAGAPTAVSWGDGRIDVFGRDTTGALRHAWAERAGGGFSAWETLPGTIVGDPTAVSWAAGRLDVFGTGAGGTLRHWWFDRASATRVWKGPETLGTTTFSGTVAATSWAQGRIDLFGRDTGGELRHSFFPWDGAFSPWERLGGGLAAGAAGVPAAVASEQDRLDVFAATADTRMRHWWWANRSWHGPEEMGTTTFAGAAAVTSWTPGRFDVFARDTNATLRHSFFRRNVDATFTAWENLGGTFT